MQICLSNFLKYLLAIKQKLKFEQIPNKYMYNFKNMIILLTFSWSEYSVAFPKSGRRQLAERSKFVH